MKIPCAGGATLSNRWDLVNYKPYHYEPNHEVSQLRSGLATTDKALYRQQSHREIPPWLGIQRGWEVSREHPAMHLVGIGPEELKTHVLVVGPTGKGKTVCVQHLAYND